MSKSSSPFVKDGASSYKTFSNEGSSGSGQPISTSSQQSSSSEGIMDKLRKALSGTDDQESQAERGGIQEMMDTTTLSWSTRVKGFAGCFLVGLLFSLLGSLLFFLGNTVGFGICYTFGSVLSLLSTAFLMGPVNQIKKMFDGTRIIATVLVIGCIVLTLFFAFKTHKGGLVLIFVILQFLSMTWYSLSYIPYARDAVKKFFEGICT